MKNVFLFILIGFIPAYLYAQQAHDTTILVNNRTLLKIHGRDTVYIPVPTPDGTIINGTKFTYVEQMPMPTVDITHYLATHIVYPKDALKNRKEGRVVVKFIVTNTGKATDASVVRSCYPSLDTEALRLIKNIPDWKPGKKDGKPVDVWFTLPVTFTLPK